MMYISTISQFWSCQSKLIQSLENRKTNEKDSHDPGLQEN